MHITMNNVELKEAVELWLENEGLTPDRYDIDVKFVAGRNGNEGRIEINAQKKVNVILEPETEYINNEVDVTYSVKEVDEPKSTGPTEEDPFNDASSKPEKQTVGDLFNS